MAKKLWGGRFKKEIDKDFFKFQQSIFYDYRLAIYDILHSIAHVKTLYKSKKKIVSYDKISEKLWKNEPDKFSLWAISQIIKRLRKKLSDYFINPNTIRSRRGEGYVFN